jgi:cytochrome c-type biogenesis protein CcmF
MEKREALKIWTILLAILDLLAVAARHLPRALGRPDLGACVSRPIPRAACSSWRCSPSSSAARWRSFAFRAQSLQAGGLFQPISREGALVLNNLFLTTATATVFVGTLYPLLVETDRPAPEDFGRRRRSSTLTFGAVDGAASARSILSDR